ncbi:Protein of unknown function DUF58 [Lishizhenia tianjinensis]|uniref:DUF58 domain-containing protein n=1 Tax=Lishizhenia tianjinensis TaxID=477690 RepID=A0A1I6XIE5_9FLAO|nr:DUF58 domain-containing protein [Lishizhenia tianjinensis]SFT38089.1 Protein of unknown function DUF58 [Lishizhenia tianjinensis]
MATTIKREDLVQFGNLELLAKQVVEGFITGLHKSPFHGFSVEFAEHRLYNKGESTRHIDWKLFARSEKLFTKKYEEETNLRCQIVLDCSSSMQFPLEEEMNKMHYAVYAIASLIELLKKQRDAVGLSMMKENLSLHTEAKSSLRHHKFLYAQLEKELQNFNKEKGTSTDASALLHDIAELTHKRSLIILFSDFLDDPEKVDDYFAAIQHLKHNKHEVIIFQVVDEKRELNFELDNKPHVLIDMETGEKMKLQPNQIKEKYAEQSKKYFDAIKLKSQQYAVDFITIDIHEDLQSVLTQYMIKRSKLY